jgi:hypothetical protein
MFIYSLLTVFTTMFAAAFLCHQFIRFFIDPASDGSEVNQVEVVNVADFGRK